MLFDEPSDFLERSDHSDGDVELFRLVSTLHLTLPGSTVTQDMDGIHIDLPARPFDVLDVVLMLGSVALMSAAWCAWMTLPIWFFGPVFAPALSQTGLLLMLVPSAVLLPFLFKLGSWLREARSRRRKVRLTLTAHELCLKTANGITHRLALHEIVSARHRFGWLILTGQDGSRMVLWKQLSALLHALYSQRARQVGSEDDVPAQFLTMLE